MRLEGKVAVVTGGASGIGAAIVERFVAEGARVVVCDLATSRGEELTASFGASTCFAVADVTDAGALRAVFDTARRWGGGLDILCNNAGIAVFEGGILDCPEEIFDRNIAVNLKAAWWGMKLAIPLMIERGGGSIINTSSLAALRAAPGQTGYGTAKAGLLQLTRVVAMEVASLGIRVNAICPGGVVTPILYANPALPRTTPEDLRARLAGSQPIPRAGEAIDIANAALFLAGDESSFVTGETIVVDGGKHVEFDAEMVRSAASVISARWARSART